MGLHHDPRDDRQSKTVRDTMSDNSENDQKIRHSSNSALLAFADSVVSQISQTNQKEKLERSFSPSPQLRDKSMISMSSQSEIKRSVTPPLSPTASHSAKTVKKTGKDILLELLKEDEEEVK